MLNALVREPPKASPGGKLSSEARLMRNAGGNLMGCISVRPTACRYCTPSLIRPFGAPSPRGKARAFGASYRFSSTSATRMAPIPASWRALSFSLKNTRPTMVTTRMMATETVG